MDKWQKLAILGGLLTLLGFLTLTEKGRGIAQTIGNWVVNISENGLELLKKLEGFSAKPYPDADGWSIGFGHYLGKTPTIQYVTREQAEALLIRDVQKALDVIKRYVKVPMNQNQIDALVSFIYNVGPNAFISSTLLKKLNAGDYHGAADEFLRWNKSRQNGVLKENPVLTARREAERQIFLS